MGLAARAFQGARARTAVLRRAEIALLLATTVALSACAGGGGPSSTPGRASASASSATASGGGIPVGFPLLGSWTTSITKDDLAAAGVTDPLARNENSGRFTWAFAPDGTWSQVQESLDGSPVNSPVFRGTYTADDGSLVATTTFPEQYRDEGLHYEFVLEGDTVRFDVLDPPDALLPIIVETHPWARAG
jgi:hypothetical protein